MFSATRREGNEAEPPYTAFSKPKLNLAPWARLDATQKRAAEQGKARRKRIAVRTPFLYTGQLSLHYLRYIIAREVAGGWRKLGGMVAELTHPAHLLGISVTRNMVTTSCFEKAQHAPGAHFVRERDNLEIIKSELVHLNRVFLQQCVREQHSESFDRLRDSRAPNSRPSIAQNPSWGRTCEDTGNTRERRGRPDKQPSVP